MELTLGYMRSQIQVLFIVLTIGCVCGIISFPGSTSVPVGTVALFAGETVPSKWILCNGTAVSRTAYSKLFGVVGISYGPGDGISTFNVPDFQGRFPYGSNEHPGQTSNGHHGGAAEVTLTEQELPLHTHEKGNLSMNIAGEHMHDYDDPGHDHGGRTGDSDYSAGVHPMGWTGGNGDDRGHHSHSISRDTTHISIRKNGSHVHEIVGRTASSGYGKPFNIIPPYETVLFIIFAG